MSENEPLNCQQAKDQLDNLIEAMVEARLHPDVGPQNAPGPFADSFDSSFEPRGALKEHLADCSECHNYQLANRVIIEAARALPRLEGDEALTQSILAAIETGEVEKSEAKASAPAPASPRLTAGSALVLAASFMAFTLTTSGFTPDAVWSAGSWALALVMVALLKPLIEGNLNINSATNSMAKA
jgi:hypothetical protein